MIEFQHLSLQYPTGKLALDRISTTIKTGEMVIVTGGIGSGKTAFLNAIALIDPPTSGSLIVNGAQLVGLPKKQIPYYRQTLGLIFGERKLFMDRSVTDNLAYPLEMIGFTQHEAHMRAKTALERVELLHKANDLPGSLTSGEKQLLCIARAIINKPNIILADEPLLNLETVMAKKIWSMLKTISQVGITGMVGARLSALVKYSSDRQLTLIDGVLTE